MKLTNAARHFDRTRVEDAFDPDTSFLGQMDLFQDVVRNGTTAERRVLSTDPAITLPGRKTVLIEGEVWVIGQTQYDHFLGERIRAKHVLAKATGLTALQTFSEVIGGLPGLPLYAALEWVKTIKETDESSTILGSFDIHFADSEPVTEGQLIRINGMWLLVRSVFPTLSGYLTAIADQLPDPLLQDVTFHSRVYNPRSDTYTSAALPLRVIRLRWQSHFRYPVQASFKFAPGDDVLIIRKNDAAPLANHTVVMPDGAYSVVTVMDEGQHWSCHVRKA